MPRLPNLPRLPRLKPRLRLALNLALIVLFITLAINTSIGLRLAYPRAVQEIAELPQFDVFRPNDRVLVVAPHPDDETLCCAGAIQLAEMAGADVWVVFLTSGDGFEWDAIYEERTLRPRGPNFIRMGESRRLEAIRAMDVLGVSEGRLFFLGYPDGGLLHLFLENYATPFESRYTRRFAVPYAEALEPGAPFTGLSVEANLRTVIDTVQPTVVLAPSPLDQHPDHRAASYFVTRIMALRDEQDRMRYWIVHGGLQWPLPKGYHPNFPLILPQRGRDLAWQRVELTEEMRERKLEALQEYPSQLRLLSRYLLAFVRENELLTPQVSPREVEFTRPP